MKYIILKNITILYMPKPYFQVDENGALVNPYNPGSSSINYEKLMCSIADIMKMTNLNDKLLALCQIKDMLHDTKENCNC